MCTLEVVGEHSIVSVSDVLIFQSMLLKTLPISMEAKITSFIDTSGNTFLGEWQTSRTLGRRYYEMTDHLGNVLATVLDRKTGAGTAPGSGGTIYDHWSADLASTADYYPGGMMMPGRNAEYSWSRMGSQSQQKDDEVYGKGNLNTALFWEMDTRILRRWNVDPLAHKAPGWSPYAAMGDNPILMFDPDGNFPYPIHIRSFAPFNTFGGGFEGDGANRGYTTATSKGEGGSVTSRLQHTVTVDPTRGSFSGNAAWCDQSSHPVLGKATAKAIANITGFKSSKDADGNSTVSFTANMKAGNPLTGNAVTPNIDVHTSFTLTENLKAGTLTVNAEQWGDKFPSAETFIGDTKGNQLFIGVSPAEGDPFSSLPGDNDRIMMSSKFTIQIDKNGVFTGVKQGDKTYKVSEWNQRMQQKPTTQQEGADTGIPPMR